MHARFYSQIRCWFWGKRYRLIVWKWQYTTSGSYFMVIHPNQQWKFCLVCKTWTGKRQLTCSSGPGTGQGSRLQDRRWAWCSLEAAFCSAPLGTGSSAHPHTLPVTKLSAAGHQLQVHFHTRTLFPHFTYLIKHLTEKTALFFSFLRRGGDNCVCVEILHSELYCVLLMPLQC